MIDCDGEGDVLCLWKYRRQNADWTGGQYIFCVVAHKILHAVSLYICNIVYVTQFL